MKDPNETQVGGDHYRSGFQHWDLVLQTNTPYLLACASKYVTRWRKKDGAQGLKKARHYLQKQVAAWRKEAGDDRSFTDYVKENTLTEVEAALVFDIHTAKTPMQLAYIIERLDALIQCQTPIEKLVDQINPSAWRGFTFEGVTGQDIALYRCNVCGRGFTCNVVVPPPLAHACAEDGAAPPRGYVDQG